MDTSSLFVPGLFQTPKVDFALNNNTSCAETLDPSEMWLKRISDGVIVGESNYTVLTDLTDPPLTLAEKQTLYRQFDPVAARVGNGGGIIGMMPSMLFSAFFSKQNFAVLQKMIKVAVFKWSGQRIGDQSIQELQNVMQSLFRDYATIVDECKTSRKQLLSHIKNEVARLDGIVISAVVPFIVNEVEQRTTLNTFLESGADKAAFDRPVADTIYGQVSYRPITDILGCQDTNCQQTRT